MHQPRLTIGLLAALTLGLCACTSDRGPLGTEKNPIKLFFVPTVDVKIIEDSSATIKTILEQSTPYKFQVSIPTSIIAVVEAFGTKRADIAAINTFGYLLAFERYGAEAGLTVLRHGSPTYQAQFIARANGPIQKLEDFAGKKMAFVDPSSTSGYLFPLKVLNDKGIKPSETMFAMRHDNVVSMVYQGQVDGGATFYSAPNDGEIQDARRLVKKQYADVESKVRIVQLTDPIPNDPVVFRKDIDPKIKSTVIDAILKLMEDPKGKEAFFNMYGATGFIRANDQDYAPVREMLRALGKSAQELAEKKK
jgi:phosphonate transport system substrate-binding protein